MEVFVARQPIFDRDQRVYGYELLFRQGLNHVLRKLNGDRATSTVLTNSFLLIGMDTLTSGKRGFVNFTRNLLLQEVATTFPTDLVAIEVLEDIEPDPDLVAACRRLKEAGYLLALDDFVFNTKFEPLIDLADIIKVDFLATDAEECQRIPQQVDNRNVKFLAEKVETNEDLQMALDSGYSYIQGYFFSKPVIVSGRDIPGYKLNYLQTLYEINRPDINFETLEAIIKRDVSLSYKLLRFINSIYFGLRHRIRTIRHALLLLGVTEIRKWASLVTLSGMGQDKADELVVLSTVRAKFCELLSVEVDLEERSADLYLMGLFSLADAFTDQPREQTLASLPIADEIKAALAGQAGRFHDIYQLIVAYEAADWTFFSCYADRLDLDERLVPQLYRQAVDWANQIFAGQNDPRSENRR